MLITHDGIANCGETKNHPLQVVFRVDYQPNCELVDLPIMPYVAVLRAPQSLGFASGAQV